MNLRNTFLLIFLLLGTGSLFAQTPSIIFQDQFSSVAENVTTINIPLTISAAPVDQASVEVFVAMGSTARANTDFTFGTQTLTFPAGSNAARSITVRISDNATPDPSRYIVLEIRNPVNATLGTIANTRHILYILDDDLQAPRATEALRTTFVSSFLVGGAGNSAEIVAYDAPSKRLFVVNSTADVLEILDFSNPANMQRIRSIAMATYGNGSQSVAIKNGVVAVAVDVNVPFGSNGKAVFFNTNGDFLSQVEVGTLPDMITFSPDGKWVMTANEGEPNSRYTIDPKGSISIIDISRGVASLTQNDVNTLNFDAFNTQEAALKASGVRIYGRKNIGTPDPINGPALAGMGAFSTVAEDLEPEYIAISNDSRTAWVTLQENNALAVVDIVSKRITNILPLGLKDHSMPTNSFDACDLGGVPIVFGNWKVRGMYQPDAIAYYEAGGVPYLVTANEGDAREYTYDHDNNPATANLTAFAEEIRVGAAGYVLDPATFPDGTILKRNHVLGRLTVTNRTGDIDNDGDFDQIHVLGGRSFSIWNANTGELVFDSGNQMELITSQNPALRSIFNASNNNNIFKDRSDNKGPEPEGVTIYSSLDRVYAFIALERIGGFMIYDITNPRNPVFVNYANSRTIPTLGGDRGAEGIIFIPAEESPNGTDLVVTANETSATVAVHSIGGVNRTLNSPVISATATNARVTISWQRELFADAYEVFIYTQAQTPRSLGITTNNSFEAVNLVNGTTYFFYVKSLNRRLNIESVTSNTVSVRPSIVLGVEEETANSLFQLYPNPNNGSFHISIKDLKGKNAQINVLDMGGRLLHQQNISTSGNIESEIDLNLTSGIYLLQVNTEKEILRRKLVIER